MTKETNETKSLASSSPNYRGRFAPTPSGDLHLGSLVGALGSFLQARSKGGEWLVRIDDIDTPRVIAGSEKSILTALEAFGLEWDGPVTRQSTRLNIYGDAFDDLKFMGKVYPCHCTRKQIHETAQHGVEGYIYPGTCRKVKENPAQIRSYRVRTDSKPVQWVDGVYGAQSMNIEAELGDFILLRADGIYSYHLSNLIDDHLDQITEIVRGSDLLLSTFRQVYLDQLFGNKTFPSEGLRYQHLPLVPGVDGEKLSKQNQATALNHQNPVPELLYALTFLGQNPPETLQSATLQEALSWAIENWDITKITINSNNTYKE